MNPHPPLDLTRSAASRAATRELSRGIYGHSDWKQALGHALLAGLRRLLAAASGNAGPVGVLVLVAAVAVAAAVVVGLVRVGAPRRNARPAVAPVVVSTHLSAAELRARATAATEVADWTTAVLTGFRAVVGELVEAGYVPATPGLTTGELVEAVSPALPAAAGELRAAAEVFGAVSYGYRPAGPADVAIVTAADRAVRGTPAGARR